jgi:membrane protein YqaA with SNARE-associated domain
MNILFIDQIAEGLDVSTPVAVLLLIVGIVQVALQVYSLIDLARRPAVAGGKKWVWLLVIALGNLLGAVIYLAIGRKADTPLEDDAVALDHSTTQSRASAAADLLYGRKEER